MRNRQSLVINDAGRDRGKRFLIIEMDAEQSEEWATRAIFTLMNCGVDVPENMLDSGMAGLAAIGIKALTKVPYDLAKPLFDQMMACVQYEFEPGREGGSRALIADDIEEVATRVKLRYAILELHLNAFLGAAQSIQASGAAGTSA